MDTPGTEAPGAPRRGWLSPLAAAFWAGAWLADWRIRVPFSPAPAHLPAAGQGPGGADRSRVMRLRLFSIYYFNLAFLLG